jgi:uncharacterized protein
VRQNANVRALVQLHAPTEYFDIPASDTKRAIAFYSKLFGWNFVKDETRDYWTITQATPNGAEVIGGLVPRIGFYPGRPELNGFINAFVCYFPVVDMDVTLHRVAELGGMAFLHKHHVPGVGWRSLAKDSEGNVLGLVQHEPKH